MNKFKKIAIPLVPTQKMMLENNDKSLRSDYDDQNSDSDLILDILVLYTKEALDDFSGRFVVKQYNTYYCAGRSSWRRENTLKTPFISFFVTSLPPTNMSSTIITNNHS